MKYDAGLSSSTQTTELWSTCQKYAKSTFFKIHLV